MADFPSLPLFTDAYLADTMHLSCLESGAYLHLLMAAWRTPDCSLPDDDKKLARYAKCTTKEWAKVRDVVLEFWTLENQKWIQKRLRKERCFVAKKRNQQSLAGKASALKKKQLALTYDGPPLLPDGNEITNEATNETATPTPTPTPTIEKNIQKGGSDDGESQLDLGGENHAGERGEPKPDFDELFDRFWSAYPKRKGNNPREKAKEKFIRFVKSGTDPEVIIRGARAYARVIEDEGNHNTQYVSQAIKWLNQKSWDGIDDNDQPDTPDLDDRGLQIKARLSAMREAGVSDGDEARYLKMTDEDFAEFIQEHKDRKGKT